MVEAGGVTAIRPATVGSQGVTIRVMPSSLAPAGVLLVLELSDSVRSVTLTGGEARELAAALAMAWSTAGMGTVA